MWRFQRTGVKGSTIKNDISGIHFYLQYHGKTLQLGKGYSDSLQKLYRGCNRMRARYEIDKTTFFRRALCNILLYPMLDCIPGETRWERTVRALLLYAHDNGFRSHNYVYNNTAEALVRVRDLTFYPSVENPQALTSKLPRSKTSQVDAPTRETRTIWCSCDRGPCAVHEMAALLKDRMNEGSEALFLMDNGFPVTYNVLRKILKTLCEAIGLDPRYYTPHSLRIGCATDMSMEGVPIEIIMKFINWKSRKSAMIYIRPDNEDFIRFQLDEIDDDI